MASLEVDWVKFLDWTDKSYVSCWKIDQIWVKNRNNFDPTLITANTVRTGLIQLVTKILKCWIKWNIKNQHTTPCWAPMIQTSLMSPHKLYCPSLIIHLCSQELWPIHLYIPKAHHQALTKLVPSKDFLKIMYNFTPENWNRHFKQ